MELERQIRAETKWSFEGGIKRRELEDCCEMHWKSMENREEKANSISW